MSLNFQAHLSCKSAAVSLKVKVMCSLCAIERAAASVLAANIALRGETLCRASDRVLPATIFASEPTWADFWHLRPTTNLARQR